MFTIPRINSLIILGLFLFFFFKCKMVILLKLADRTLGQKKLLSPDCEKELIKYFGRGRGVKIRGVSRLIPRPTKYILG